MNRSRKPEFDSWLERFLTAYQLQGPFPK